MVDLYFEGFSEASPSVDVHVCRESWGAMGRILVAGLEQVGYFLIRFFPRLLLYKVSWVGTYILRNCDIPIHPVIMKCRWSSIRAALTAVF